MKRPPVPYCGINTHHHRSVGRVRRCVRRQEKSAEKQTNLVESDFGVGSDK